MWRFISGIRQRRILRRSFSRYLSKELVDSLMRSPDQRLSRETKRVVRDYLIFQIQDTSLENIQQHVSTGVETILDCGGIVEGMMCSVVMATFGFPFAEDSTVEDADMRAKAATCLTRTLGSNVRVIHGRSEALVGLVGSERRSTFGSLIPHFARRLRTLQDLEFGQSVEV